MALRHWFITLLLLFSLPLSAQVEEALEQWVEETDDTEAAAEMSDLLLQLQDNPVNINDTHTIAALPFITPFQSKALTYYIALNGQLLSLKELHFIPGFDSSTIALLESISIAIPYEQSRHWRIKDGRHRLVTGIGGTIEQAEGYRNGQYEGDNLRALLCYQYSLYHHLDLRITMDKDPTEAWGKENYYGYHLMLTDIGRIDKLILGRYNLQFGQGLTLWTGLRPFNLTGSTPLRHGAGIRPAAAFYEDGYQEGVATQVNLGSGIHLAAFGSRHASETLAGSHLTYRHNNLILGLTAAYTLLNDSVSTRDYVYNQNRFQGNWQFNAGVDFTWQWRKLTLYGEASIGENGSPAAIGGLILQADSRNRFGVSYRHYTEQYHNLHAQAYAIGASQGERGITLDAETRLPLGCTLLTSLDLHRFPALRYASYRPSDGQWLRTQLSRQWGRYISTTLRHTYRLKERNIPNLDSTLYLGEKTLRQQLQGEVTGTLGRWTLKGRGVLSRFESEQGEPQQGWLAAISARYSHECLQVTAAAAWFDVDGYYARIYLSESNMQYAWSMPALNGNGLRAYILIRWRLNRHLTLAGKYTLTWMLGEESIGSGDSRTNGPLRQTWFLQLRSSF